MKFRTEVQVKEKFSLTHEDAVLSVGSCFADHMGQRLADHNFQVMQNPFGVLFHPLAQAQVLSRVLKGAVVTENHLFEKDG